MANLDLQSVYYLINWLPATCGFPPPIHERNQLNNCDTKLMNDSEYLYGMCAGHSPAAILYMCIYIYI